MNTEDKIKRLEYLVARIITDLQDFQYFRRCKLTDIPLGQIFDHSLVAENLKEDIEGKIFPYRLGKHKDTIMKDLDKSIRKGE
jgi:hypothetical protein